jgi:arylsulfatase A-like enzyme
LTGAALPEFVDGRSLAPLLEGRSPSAWREATLVEAFGRDEVIAALEIGHEPNNPPFKALRLVDRVYVEYPRSGERELYDLRADPLQLENLAGDPAHADEIERLHTWLATLLNWSGEACREAEESPP